MVFRTVQVTNTSSRAVLACSLQTTTQLNHTNKPYPGVLYSTHQLLLSLFLPTYPLLSPTYALPTRSSIPSCRKRPSTGEELS